MSVTTTPLVKGELDWHNKINDNTNLLQTEINNISDENVENSLAKQIKINKQEIDNMKDGTKDGSLQQQINNLMTKTSFACIPTTGFKISDQDSYLLNGEYFACFKISKIDGSTFVGYDVCTLPFIGKGVTIANAMGSSGSGWSILLNAYIVSNTVYVVSNTPCTEIYISCKGGVA